MTSNEISDFIFRNYCKRIRFFKESSYYSRKRSKKKDLILVANKLIEKVKVPFPRNAKKHDQSFIRKKNRKSVKQWEIITYQRKTSENPSTVDIKSFITVNPKNSHNLSKTIGKGEKVGSNSSLCGDIDI